MFPYLTGVMNKTKSPRAHPCHGKLWMPVELLVGRWSHHRSHVTKEEHSHGAHMDGFIMAAIRQYFIDVIVMTQLMDKEHLATIIG